jgi:gamma-glutamylcyclotransferase (GGCT)/AIG2-like uncharacterized protein YtfP
VVDVVMHLFVYGTLLAGERNAGQIPDAAVLERRRARVRGTLMDLGRYPALRVGDHDGDAGEVVGELLTLSTTAASALLAGLDAFEGPGYARHALTVHVDGEGAPVVAWVFVQVSGSADGPRIPGGDWRAWRRRRDGDQTL